MRVKEAIAIFAHATIVKGGQRNRRICHSNAAMEQSFHRLLTRAFLGTATKARSCYRFICTTVTCSNFFYAHTIV